MMIDNFVRTVKEIKDMYAEVNKKSKDLHERIMLVCNRDELMASYLERCVAMIADGKLEADRLDIVEDEMGIASFCLKAEEMIQLGSEEVKE
jgi:hypothetical protein